MKQINSSFGSGGMALAMNKGEFASFLMFLKSNILVNECLSTMQLKLLGSSPDG